MVDKTTEAGVSTAGQCVKCGHSGEMRSNGTCYHFYDNTICRNYCMCKCEFAAPDAELLALCEKAETEAQDERIRIGDNPISRMLEMTSAALRARLGKGDVK